MDIESKSTFERSLVEGINLFTGAGFSVLSADLQGRSLPVGDDLKKEILKEFPGAPKTLQLPQLCTLISRTKRDELDRYNKARFEIGEFSEKYKNLPFVNLKNIFTTNIDNLIECIFRGS